MSEPKSVEFSVNISESLPQEVLFFDRFAVFRRGNFVELHFGFFGSSPDLIHGLVVVVQRDVFQDAKQSFIDFIALGGNIPEPTELPAFKIRSEAQVLAADLVGLARHRALGEITFHALSWKVGIDLAKGASKSEATQVKAAFVALLRCDLQLQKRWVLALYDTDEDND